MYNFRTDLALERRDIYQKINNLQQIDGIESTEEQINEEIERINNSLEALDNIKYNVDYMNKVLKQRFDNMKLYINNLDKNTY